MYFFFLLRTRFTAGWFFAIRKAPKALKYVIQTKMRKCYFRKCVICEIGRYEVIPTHRSIGYSMLNVEFQFNQWEERRVSERNWQSDGTRLFCLKVNCKKYFSHFLDLIWLLKKTSHSKTGRKWGIGWEFRETWDILCKCDRYCMKLRIDTCITFFWLQDNYVW